VLRDAARRLRLEHRPVQLDAGEAAVPTARSTATRRFPVSRSGATAENRSTLGRPRPRRRTAGRGRQRAREVTTTSSVADRRDSGIRQKSRVLGKGRPAWPAGECVEVREGLVVALRKRGLFCISRVNSCIPRHLTVQQTGLTKPPRTQAVLAPLTPEVTTAPGWISAAHWSRRPFAPSVYFMSASVSRPSGVAAEEPASAERQSQTNEEDLKAYLGDTLVPLLAYALDGLEKIRPPNPVLFLAHFLLRHNPRKLC
jgi:protein dpy-30